MLILGKGSIRIKYNFNFFIPQHSHQVPLEGLVLSEVSHRSFSTKKKIFFSVKRKKYLNKNTTQFSAMQNSSILKCIKYQNVKILIVH